jgi:acylphosphatase
MRFNRCLTASFVLVLTAASFTLPSATPAAAEHMASQTVVAISGHVTGNVQKVGFRAMIQKEAIQYNLAGTAENNNDGSVLFVLQGQEDRIDEALEAIRKGTKKSSDVTVNVSSKAVKADLDTFTVFGWTSVSRHISHPYDLVFNRRRDDKIISKQDAKAVWLEICEKTVEGDDVGKCDKDDQ